MLVRADGSHYYSIITKLKWIFGYFLYHHLTGCLFMMTYFIMFVHVGDNELENVSWKAYMHGQSLDLNSFEILWCKLKNLVNDKAPNCKSDLATKDICNQIDGEYCFVKSTSHSRCYKNQTRSIKVLMVQWISSEFHFSSTWSEQNWLNTVIFISYFIFFLMPDFLKNYSFVACLWFISSFIQK